MKLPPIFNVVLAKVKVALGLTVMLPETVIVDPPKVNGEAVPTVKEPAMVSVAPVVPKVNGPVFVNEDGLTALVTFGALNVPELVKAPAIVRVVPAYVMVPEALLVIPVFKTHPLPL